MRWAAIGVVAFVGLGVAGSLVLGRVNLAGLVAGRASAALGRAAPMRVRAADGVIGGSATFYLNRRVFDVTVASESGTTGAFALDVPVRVSGPFGNPSVAPAQLSAAGRAELAAADDMSRLPPGLREMARRYACPGSGR